MFAALLVWNFDQVLADTENVLNPPPRHMSRMTSKSLRSAYCIRSPCVRLRAPKSAPARSTAHCSVNPLLELAQPQITLGWRINGEYQCAPRQQDLDDITDMIGDRLLIGCHYGNMQALRDSPLSHRLLISSFIAGSWASGPPGLGAGTLSAWLI
jgi:hypothetical protein